MNREKELEAALASLVQKAERLDTAIAELLEAEAAYKSNWDVAVGSEQWVVACNAMLNARTAVRHDQIILGAVLREAKDTLYTEAVRKSA